VFFLNYDEDDGYFDHVSPPGTHRARLPGTHDRYLATERGVEEPNISTWRR
jgi:phospholipase C